MARWAEVDGNANVLIGGNIRGEVVLVYFRGMQHHRKLDDGGFSDAKSGHSSPNIIPILPTLACR